MLSKPARLSLVRQAHTLNPVIWVGREGASPAVLKEIDAALKAHELIKIKLRIGETRAERQEVAEFIAATLKATLVNTIGQVAVYFRPAA